MTKPTIISIPSANKRLTTLERDDGCATGDWRLRIVIEALAVAEWDFRYHHPPFRSRTNRLCGALLPITPFGVSAPLAVAYQVRQRHRLPNRPAPRRCGQAGNDLCHPHLG